MVCYLRFAGEIVARLHRTVEAARLTCAIVDAAAKVRDLTSNTSPKAKARPSPPAPAPHDLRSKPWE